MRLVLNDERPAPVASCDHIGRRFDVRGSSVVALDDVSFEVGAGTLVAVAGPSGSGKSTLLSILGCLDRPTAGSVRVTEQELTLLGRADRRQLRRSAVAMVLPQPSDNLMVRRTGVDNLRLAATHRGAPPSSIGAAIEAVGIAGFVDREAGRMSGGEQQRLALACALVGRTALVLADEPTGALDDLSAEQVVDAMLRATGQGATVVAATHDPAVIAAATNVIRLEHGRQVP